MIGIVYDKTTKKIRSMIVPNADENYIDVFNSVNLFSYEELLILDKDVNGYPNVNELQTILNKQLKCQKSI